MLKMLVAGEAFLIALSVENYNSKLHPFMHRINFGSNRIAKRA